MELETINKLYLELSQVATAKTQRELQLEERLERLTGAGRNPAVGTHYVPRRQQLSQLTPAEKAIRAAVDAVEAAGAHTLLTDAVVLLGYAKEKVADFVELEQCAARGT